MPLDGCFIHYLVNELKYIEGSKITKIYQPSYLDIILNLRLKNKDGLLVNQNLLLSSRLDSPRIHITTLDYSYPQNPSSFCMFLRKHLERGIIKSIKQHSNDRIVIIQVHKQNEIEIEQSVNIIFELMGRNSNIIITDNNFTIFDAIRKFPPSDETSRPILPHASYSFLNIQDKVNPFTNYSENLNYIGMSSFIKSIIKEYNQEELTSYLNQLINPVIYKTDNKIDFYSYLPCKDALVINTYDTISIMLDEFYKSRVNVTNSDKTVMEKIVKRELKKGYTKHDKLEIELSNAYDNIKFTNLGILLQANLYKVKKGDSFIEVENFLEDGNLVKIYLNELLDPSTNLKKIFQKGKKAKTAISILSIQLEKVLSEIEYFENIAFSISIANNEELSDIKDELSSINLINKGKQKKEKKDKTINILKTVVDDCTIYVGKNNIQNDYLTNKLARKNDYFFHVKDIPGSHVILKVPSENFILTENLIRTCSNIASYFSKASTSSSVPVDYTKIASVKKIKGVFGSKVIISNQKTIYIDPDETLIKKLFPNL